MQRAAYIEKGYENQIVPIYQNFFAWLEEISGKQSTDASKQAVNYTLNARDDLIRFTERWNPDTV